MITKTEKKRRYVEEDDGQLSSLSESGSTSQSCSSSETKSESDYSSDDERAMVQRVRKGKKIVKSKKLKSGISEKSHCSDIERKCKWPSSMLDSVFDDEDISFKELTMPQFLYGELCIWDRPSIKKDELNTHHYLLKKMIRNEPKLGFQKVKEIYKNFLTKVEKGIVRWKDKMEIDRIKTEVILNCINIHERVNKFAKF